LGERVGRRVIDAIPVDMKVDVTMGMVQEEKEEEEEREGGFIRECDRCIAWFRNHHEG